MSQFESFDSCREQAPHSPRRLRRSSEGGASATKTAENRQDGGGPRTTSNLGYGSMNSNQHPCRRDGGGRPHLGSVYQYDESE